jgi:hypothetical protein
MMMTFEHDRIASAFQGLIYRVFQEGLGANPDRGIAIAFVAAHQDAGTTFLATRLTETLHLNDIRPAVLLDCRRMVHGHNDALYVPHAASTKHAFSHSSLVLRRGDWRSNRDLRKQSIQMLRNRFSYVLLDCPSLRESKDILGLTTLVDGVVMVVEANRTSKSQLGHLERVIAEAGGNIVGTVLNKRTYPVPAWCW